MHPVVRPLLSRNRYWIHYHVKHRWVNHISENPEDLEIISERTDPYPGLHKVKYQSAMDEIEITHNAHNRNGFALGAVLAAEFMKDRKGILSMKEVLGL